MQEVKKITPITFYGKKKETTSEHETKWRNMIANVEEYTKKETDGFYQWFIYSKQEQAITKQEQSKWPLHIFTFEYDVKNPGRRKYLVTTYKQFFKRYLDMPLNKRHYYELIKQNVPCHLYFDLEYSKECNPNASLKIMDIFKSCLKIEFHRVFNISLSKSDMVDLDSSSATKYSRHLIVHMQTCAFVSNYHVGLFVNQFVARLDIISTTMKECDESEYGNVADIKSLYQKNGQGELQILIDSSVYSKNRQFRLLYSTKMGKETPFEVSNENKYIVHEGPGMKETFFLSTLVGNVNFDLCKRLLDTSDLIQHSLKSDTSSKKRVKTDDIFQALSASPFPEIDQFVLQSIRVIVPSSRIKSVTFFAENKVIVYNITGNRYCHRIQREHKSNGVYYVVELNKGIFTQRCFDRDCYHYMSPEMNIPMELNPFVKNTENCDVDLPEEKREYEFEISDSQLLNFEMPDL